MAKVISVENIQQDLESYIQSGNLNFLIGSGASFPGITLAGNIESEINALIEAEKTEEADLAALSFIQKLELRHEQISEEGKDADTDLTLASYVKFLSAVDLILFERKNHLLPRQANIFTTNYDLFIEYAAAKLPALILIDGFDRTDPRGTHKFSPELFLDRTYRTGSVYTHQSEVPAVNLFKLHGSLNWSRASEDVILRTKANAPLPMDPPPNDVAASSALSDRVLILPNLKKFGTTLLDRVYYDLLRFFSNAAENENSVILTFGFSFADEHILDVTKRALRNPTSQLIVFAFDQAAAENFQTVFKAHRNVIVVAPANGSNLDFETFSNTLSSSSPRRDEAND